MSDYIERKISECIISSSQLLMISSHPESIKCYLSIYDRLYILCSLNFE